MTSTQPATQQHQRSQTNGVEDDEGSVEAPDPPPTSRSIEAAKRHFRNVTIGAVLVAIALVAMGVHWPWTGGESFADADHWLMLFYASLLGALTERTYAIGYHGFKVKDYEPLTLRYHLAVGLRATLVALAFVALGDAVVTIDTGRPVLMAFGFGAGYFGEATFEAFRRRFRALIGSPASSTRPVQHPLDGWDVPLEDVFAELPEQGELPDLPDDWDRDELASAVRTLVDEGYRSTLEVAGTYRTESGRAELERLFHGDDEDRADEAAETARKVAAIADIMRTGLDTRSACCAVEAGIQQAEEIAHGALDGGGEADELGSQLGLPERDRKRAQERARRQVARG